MSVRPTAHVSGHTASTCACRQRSAPSCRKYAQVHVVGPSSVISSFRALPSTSHSLASKTRKLSLLQSSHGSLTTPKSTSKSRAAWWSSRPKVAAPHVSAQTGFSKFVEQKPDAKAVEQICGSYREPVRPKRAFAATGRSLAASGVTVGGLWMRLVERSKDQPHVV